MKIAFPLNSPNELASDFAHSRFIGFYEDSEDKIEVVPMQELLKYSGSGIFPDVLISKDLYAIVSGQISIIALRILGEYGILAFRASGNNFMENIQSFVSRDLKPFNLNESVIQDHCGGSCSACGSSCA